MLCIIDEWAHKETQVLKLSGMGTKRYNDKQIQDHPIIAKFLSPVELVIEQTTNFPVKLIHLREICNQRHIVAHLNIRSVENQRSFLDECQVLKIPDEFSHGDLVKMMIHHLSNLDSDPENTNLTSFHS